MEMQAAMQAAHLQNLHQEKIQYDDQVAAHRAFEALQHRLLDLRMEYVDEPDKAAKKAEILMSSGSFRSFLDERGDVRDTLLVEISQDGWTVDAFAKAQPGGSAHIRWFLCAACLSPGAITQERLLDAGVDPNFNSTEHHGGPSPLWLTCEKVTDYTGYEAETPEDDKALSDAYFTKVQLLVRHGADVNLPLASDCGWGPEYYVAGCTPLHEAAVFERLRLAAFLVENGADIHAVDRCGRTPYDIASFEWGGSPILDLLS
jgi:hypothetical protein